MVSNLLTALALIFSTTSLSQDNGLQSSEAIDNSKCESFFNIANLDSIAKLTNDDNFQRCKAVSGFQGFDQLDISENSPENGFQHYYQLLGEDGCDCVAKKNNPISCESYNNFLNLLFNNQEVLYKVKFLNQTLETLELASDINPNQEACKIDEEIKSCTFPNNKLSLQDIIENNSEYIGPGKINDISTISDIHASRPKNKLHLKRAGYELLLYNLDYDGSSNDLPQDTKNKIRETIQEKIVSIERELSGAQISSTRSYNIARHASTRVYFYRSFTPPGSFTEGSDRDQEDNTTPSGSEASIFTDRSDFELYTEDGRPNWKMIAELIESNNNGGAGFANNIINQYLDLREKVILEDWKTSHSEICESLKKKVTSQCQFIASMDKGEKIPPPSALKTIDLIRLARDLAHKKIPTNIPDNSPLAIEYKDLINYNFEWFVCASNYYEDPEMAKKFADIENCENPLFSGKKIMSHEEASAFHQSTEEMYYNIDGLSDEQKSYINKQTKHITKSYSDKGMISNDKSSAKYSQNNISGTTGSGSPDPSGSIGTTNRNIANSKINGNSSRDFRSKSNSSSVVGNSSISNNTNAYGDNSPKTPKNSDINTGLDLNERRIKDLLKQLEEKRIELEKLEEKLATAKKKKTKTKPIKNKIRSLKDNIKKIETEIEDVTKVVAEQKSKQKKPNAQKPKQSNRQPLSLPENNTNISDVSRSTTRSGGQSSADQQISSSFTQSLSQSYNIESIKSVSSDSSTVESFNFDDNINFLVDEVNNGLVKIVKTESGDFLQIWKKIDEKNVELVQTYPISVGQGINKVLESLELTNNASIFKKFKTKVCKIYGDKCATRKESPNSSESKKKQAAKGSKRNATYDEFDKIKILSD